MPLTRVTITGADDKVDPAALRALSTEFPFVEWGILRSASREGEPRYPSAHWRERLELAWEEPPEMALAAHFCGQLTRDTLGGDDKWFRSLPAEYDRVQINGFQTNRFVEELVGRFDVEWILQCRSEAMVDQAGELVSWLTQSDACRVSALWDCSGGRGIRAELWPTAPPGLRLGYAGGITPANVRQVLGALGGFAHAYWIDMESGVRTDDRLDLLKVRQVLEAARPFVLPANSGGAQ